MSLASAIVRVEGRAIVLRGSDIDTDRIMPARFLKAITFSGLEQHLFADDRAAARATGTPHPFDASGAAGASLLVTHANFGCGSSREHAPQALQRWGIRAIAAESFSPIFAGNAQAIGLVCVTLDRAAIDDVMARVTAAPAIPCVLDLDQRTLQAGDAVTHPIVLSDAQREAWLTGAWDAAAQLLADYDDVLRVEARLPYLRTTSRNA